MGSRRSKRRSQRWGSGGVCGRRITVEGWRNRAISWRSAGFGLSLSAFLNSLQSDGHFEVPQSCLNPAWKDAENREAGRGDRKNTERERVEGQDEAEGLMTGGKEARVIRTKEASCFRRMTGGWWAEESSECTDTVWVVSFLFGHTYE